MGAPVGIEKLGGCGRVVGELKRFGDNVQGKRTIAEVMLGSARGLNQLAEADLIKLSTDDLIGNILIPTFELNGLGITDDKQRRISVICHVWLGEARKGKEANDTRRRQLLTALAFFPSDAAETRTVTTQTASELRDVHLTSMIKYLFHREELLAHLNRFRNIFLSPSHLDSGSASAVERIARALDSEISEEKVILTDVKEREEVRSIFLPFLASTNIGHHTKRYMANVVFNLTPHDQDREIPPLFYLHLLGSPALMKEETERVEAPFLSGQLDDFILMLLDISTLTGEDISSRTWYQLANIVAKRGDLKFLPLLAERLTSGVRIEPSISASLCMGLNGIICHEENRKNDRKLREFVYAQPAWQLAVASMEMCIRAEDQEPGGWHDQVEMIRLVRTLNDLYPFIMQQGQEVSNLMKYFLRNSHYSALEDELDYFRQIIWRGSPIPVLEPEQYDEREKFREIVNLRLQLSIPQLEGSARERILQLINSSDGGLTTDDLTTNDIEMWRVLINRVVAPSGRVEFLTPLAQRLHEFSEQADQLSNTGVYNAGLLCGAIGEIIEHRLVDSRQVISDEDSVKLISDVLILYQRRDNNTVETTIRMLGLIHTLLGARTEVSGNIEFCRRLLQAFPNEPSTVHGIDGFSEADLIEYIRHTIELYRESVRK